MRGSAAESRGNVNSYKGDTATRGANGYALKPSSQSERGGAGAQRAANGKNELRLGKLQVVVWLGLALGSIVGAYFVGYFSGRYVGFESARESSIGEVAKLPLTDGPQGGNAQNPGVVYDKLKAPAVLRESEPHAAAEKNRLNTQPIPVIDSQRDASNQDEISVDLGEGDEAMDSSKVVNSGSGSDSGTTASDSEIEAIVQDSSSGPQLIIGSEQGLDSAKVPSSVRMLGSGEGSAQKAPAKVDASGKTEKSASALLDERIANARSDLAKANQNEASPAKVSSGKSGADGGPLVRKVVPSGYFAQVAAPKKVTDAEKIAGKLKRSGFPVVVESASVAGQGFYRVLVGPEQNKVQADRLVSQLKGESYLVGDPFIRRVK